MLEFRLLGPVEVWAGGSRVALGQAEAAKTRCLLAVLLRTPRAVVATDALVDRVWGEDPPGTAVRYKYVGWLRSALAPHGVWLTRQDAGYVLDVDPEQVDLHRFRRLVAEAGDADGAAEPDKASRLLEEALGLWRGAALSGLSGDWVELFRGQIEREHRAARVLRARCAMASGEVANALRWLDEWEAEYPADEEIIAMRMRALFRSGQRAQALACFQRARQRLRDILAISPGDELLALYQRILDGDQDAPAPPPAAAPVPRQLPSAVPVFAGRDQELASLDAILAGAGHAVICAVSGTAGVGKTALAVHWAHRVTGQFPDGQLYVNLRGFDPSLPPLEQGEALRGFLDALGVPLGRIPAGMPAQAALYRSLLAGKRVLVLLDNAKDAEQVRPLLPGSPGCLAVVTSRDHLGGLVAAEGAYPLTLDLLTAAQARELLVRRLGAGRVAGEQEAVDDIVTRCARLPLALVIAAARAAMHPGFPLAVLAAELRAASQTLNAFGGGDTATDVRAVLSWSYRTLGADAARLFRLLALHPGPDISAPAAASLAGVAPGQATALLTELARAHLLTEHAAGRYSFHDLLRVYAAEQGRAHEDEEARRLTMIRVLDHYSLAAETAACLMNPVRDQASTAQPPGVTREALTDYRQALAWFSAERPVLVVLVSHAAVSFGSYAARLAGAMTSFLDLRGYWVDQEAVSAAALQAARRAGNLAGEAAANFGLGVAYSGQTRFDEARTCYRLALEVFSERGDHTGQAMVHMNLAWVAGLQGDHAQALEDSRRSLRHYQAARKPAGEARALNNIGWHLAGLHQYEEALPYCQRALTILRETGDVNSQAHLYHSIGYIHHRLGRHDQAADGYQQALHLFRATAEPYGEANCLTDLGDVHNAAGDPNAARKAWNQALDILTRLDHPDATHLRTRLTPP